ncbi:reverse transcriptase zinc-binding domain-containing protein [Artemisia annua]|uniref:Reverse transcriptase zinc-binding domain-containing protein n=1 Tax=Artemisia annua TaxID=35608 RepID=A0A2U1L0Z7_ARTAN|nr:reverse transcriptase zinc-binding domain-containing protein [Artemisia annua]
MCHSNLSEGVSDEGIVLITLNTRNGFCNFVKANGFIGLVPDSHDHLFFDCDATSKIWAKVKMMVKLDNAPSRWSDIISFMISRPCNKSIWSVLQRLVIGASVYMLWQERNSRTFQDLHRSIDDICKNIIDTVRLRIMGLRINDSVQVFEAARIWNFHVKKIAGWILNKDNSIVYSFMDFWYNMRKSICKLGVRLWFTWLSGTGFRR